MCSSPKPPLLSIICYWSCHNLPDDCCTQPFECRAMVEAPQKEKSLSWDQQHFARGEWISRRVAGEMMMNRSCYPVAWETCNDKTHVVLLFAVWRTGRVLIAHLEVGSGALNSIFIVTQQGSLPLWYEDPWHLHEWNGNAFEVVLLNHKRSTDGSAGKSLWRMVGGL